MKKVLKKTAKIIGIILAGVLAFLALLCIITLCWGITRHTAGEVTDTLPAVAEDFVPTVRLVIFTDTHNENDNVADAIDTAYTLFEKDDTYKGVDAFYCLGDFSSIGEEDAYKAYTDTLKAHLKKETPCITIHGNHEFKDPKYKEYFEKYFGYAPDNVQTINGFSCIAFSGERSLTEWTFTPKSLKWFSNAVDDASRNANGKAVFVFQHPHPWGTVYGSSVWGDPQINIALNGHSNVVDFSGHSHFPMNDPRSINQTTYTAVGCGALHRFELDKNGVVNQHPESCDEAAQMCIVEADNDGSVRIRGYDLLSDTYFCDYYTDNVNDKAAFPYTYKNMKAHDKAPVFSEDMKAEAQQNEAGEWLLTFTEAEAAPGYIVHEYDIQIKDKVGKIVWQNNIVNDYYTLTDGDTATVNLGAGTLQAGKTYTVKLRAESAYHYYSAKSVEVEFKA